MTRPAVAGRHLSTSPRRDRGPPNLSEAERWLRVAERLFDGAGLALTRKPVESLAHSSKAVEFALKSLLYLVGYVPRPARPRGSDAKLVAGLLDGTDRELVSGLQGRIARLGLLYDVTAPLQSIADYSLKRTTTGSLVNEADAKTFQAFANECLELARQVIAQVRQGTLKVV